MSDSLKSPQRRLCFSAVGGGMLGLGQWGQGILWDAVPPLRRVLDGPSCLMEHQDILAPARARYQPSAGGTTGGRRCTPAGKPRLLGAKLADSLVVVSGLGGVVQRVGRDGAEMWRVELAQPRGLAVTAAYVLVGDGRKILWLAKDNGRVAGAIEFPWPVSAFSLHSGSLAVAFKVQGPGAVRVYTLRGFGAQELYRIEDSLNYPRGVCLTGGALYVADTFGHKVLAYTGGQGRFARPAATSASFYPNSVRLHGDQLLVAEEHINQIVAMDPQTLARLPAVAACWPGRGRAVEVDALIARVNERRADGESICRARSPMGPELFAPNDAVGSRSALYVADTDNHRIVMYHAGVLTSVLSNFNEPVNVDIVS
jgi:hypothetical protein